jgi:hypothetical protein
MAWTPRKSLDKRPICLVSWKLVTTSKKKGGMGIRDIEAMNKSFLTKWM